jgi:uncharacterized protein (TIGR02246 family)
MSLTIDTQGRVSPASPEAEAVLLHVLSGWNEAAAHWNVEALASMYTPDALMFGGLPGHSVGAAGIRDYFGAYAGRLAFADLALVDQYVVRLGPDSIAAQGFGVFKFRLVDGRLNGATMRTSLLLERREGQWRIRQHHFSPIPDRTPIDD